VVRASELDQHLKNFEAGKNDPLILFCEDGHLSMAEAERLQRQGYTQVYVIEGGTDGLLREADDFPSSGSIR